MIWRRVKIFLKIIGGGALLIAVLGLWFADSKEDAKRPGSNEDLKLTIKSQKEQGDDDRGRSNIVPDEEVVKAVTAFKAACKPLGEMYWSDVIEVISSPEWTAGAVYLAQRGWNKVIRLQIRMKANRYRIPPGIDRASDEAFVSGHDPNLFYDLGGGKDPGFFAARRSSVALCGLPLYEAVSGRSVFKSVPELSFLDNSAPNAESEYLDERMTADIKRKLQLETDGKKLERPKTTRSVPKKTR